MKQIDNIKALRNDLLSVYTGLRNGKIQPSEAKEATQTARAVISSCKVQIMYAKMNGEKVNIDFLES